MAFAYESHFAPTPQTEPLPGQVPNSAGGFSWAVDCWTRLDRFLILGSEGPTYYASARELTGENVQSVQECAAADPARTVRRIVEISTAGRAPKNDAAILALAICAAMKDPIASKLALAAMPEVCRIGTHLFQFASYVNKLRGWGRGLRRAVAQWYVQKTPDDLAYQVTKYQQRGGFSHRDLLRLAHPRGLAEHDTIFRWVSGGVDCLNRTKVDRRISTQTGDGIRSDTYNAYQIDHLPPLIQQVEQARKATSEAEIVKLIHDGGLVREHIPTQWLNSPAVWEALLQKMPLAAMIRSLGKMSAIGLLRPLSVPAKLICDRLADKAALRFARIHPLTLLTAQKVYEQGHGDKGKLAWQPVGSVVDALDTAFYDSFATIKPTGKRWLLGLDVSGSMECGTVAGSPLTPRQASAAMSLVTAATEAHYIMGFSDRLVPVNISPKQRLDDVIKTIEKVPMGGTDCALPMVHAKEQRLQVDAFVVYTDSETWYGKIHPAKALCDYRQAMGIPAKLIVVGMTSGGFTIADPADSGMLDLVGFDTAAPALMADFVSD